MNLILFDDNIWEELLPITFVRPACEVRTGILTIREKWEKRTGAKASWITRPHLAVKHPVNIADENLLVSGTLLPSDSLVEAVLNLKSGQALETGGRLIAMNMGREMLNQWIKNPDTLSLQKTEIASKSIDHYCKIFSLNGEEIRADFDLLTKGRKSAVLSSTNTVIGNQIFVEEGVQAECAVFNTQNGPVYLGADSEVMEGCMVRGPFALCDHSTLKMSAKIYGPTTIGPHSKVGGEVNNSVILGYSNKAHDGFLGNAVIGEWCNLGADTNNSNLKNTYGEVKMWNYPRKSYEGTGLVFAGLVMGDHTKCGIDTMFITGAVIGVAANLFGAGFHRAFIPSFTWGGPSGYKTFQLPTMLKIAAEVLKRRNLELSQADKDILQWVFTYTSEYRKGSVDDV